MFKNKIFRFKKNYNFGADRFFIGVISCSLMKNTIKNTSEHEKRQQNRTSWFLNPIVALMDIK